MSLTVTARDFVSNPVSGEKLRKLQISPERDVTVGTASKLNGHGRHPRERERVENC